jgi:hypothetical protein
VVVVVEVRMSLVSTDCYRFHIKHTAQSMKLVYQAVESVEASVRSLTDAGLR